jgi:hypothetical protein
MSMVLTPDDWMDLADWDRYWSEVLADGFWRQVNLETWHFHSTSLCYLQQLERREGHRVLLAGNGISPEPYGFVHAGCDVTVVDVSAVACRFVASLEVTPSLLATMFTVFVKSPEPGGWNVWEPNLEKSLVLVAEEHRPGGCLSIVPTDLFTYEPEQPFHAIFSRRAYQGLPLDRREELARRFFRWLRPGGLAFIEMLNIRERKPFEEPFRAAGFREAKNWTRGGRGKRRVIFWHGSG